MIRAALAGLGLILLASPALADYPRCEVGEDDGRGGVICLPSRHSDAAPPKVNLNHTLTFGHGLTGAQIVVVNDLSGRPIFTINIEAQSITDPDDGEVNETARRVVEAMRPYLDEMCGGAR